MVKIIFFSSTRLHHPPPSTLSITFMLFCRTLFNNPDVFFLFMIIMMLLMMHLQFTEKFYSGLNFLQKKKRRRNVLRVHFVVNYEPENKISLFSQFLILAALLVSCMDIFLLFVYYNNNK